MPTIMPFCFSLGKDDDGGGQDAATLTEHICLTRCHSKDSACINPINPHNCPRGRFYCKGGNRGIDCTGEVLRQTALC